MPRPLLAVHRGLAAALFQITSCLRRERPPRFVDVTTQTSKTGKDAGVQPPVHALLQRSPQDDRRPPRSGAHEAVRHGRIAKKWSRDTQKTHVLKGLRNRQNDCYRNAVLQCLLHIPEWYDYLKGMSHVGNCSKDYDACLPCALMQLAQDYWAGNRSPDSPKGPRKSLETLTKAILACSRNDEIYDEIKRQDQSDAYQLLQLLIKHLAAVETPSDSLSIHDLLGIEHEIRRTCSACGEVTTSLETRHEGAGIGLHVRIVDSTSQPPTPTYLTDLLPSLFTEQVHLRCSSAACEATHAALPPTDERRNTPMTRRRIITTCPEILIVQLERGYPAGWNDKTNRMIMRKSAREVGFAEFLNLGAYTHAGLPLMYQLRGVVVHSGASLGAGHYVACVREQDGEHFLWVDDDQTVGRVRLQWMQRPMGKFDPYLLFYSKI